MIASKRREARWGLVLVTNNWSSWCAKTGPAPYVFFYWIKFRSYRVVAAIWRADPVLLVERFRHGVTRTGIRGCIGRQLTSSGTALVENRFGLRWNALFANSFWTQDLELLFLYLPPNDARSVNFFLSRDPQTHAMRSQWFQWWRRFKALFIVVDCRGGDPVPYLLHFKPTFTGSCTRRAARFGRLTNL